MAEAVDVCVERGRRALRTGDAASARAAVDALADEDAVRGDVLEVLARADYLDLRFVEAIEGWERAYAAHRGAGDQSGAIRVARTLAGLYHSVVGDFAVSAGWLARARTLLGDTPHAAERGWVELNAGMFEPDRQVKNRRFRDALAQARASGDQALEVAALGYLGASLVHGDEVAEGMRLLDEALAALVGDEVDDFFVLEEVFCQLFSACERAGDVGRADQWIRMGEAITARRNLPAVAAFCSTHYGGVLTAAGRWTEADAALTEAVRLWSLGQRSSVLRGGALVRLADLRVRQGRYEEAASLLADLDPVHVGDAAQPLAAIHLARGERALARDLLERALAPLDEAASEAAPVLGLLVEVLLAEDDVDAAELAAERLAVVAATAGDHVRAAAALARGRVCVASGSGDARSCFREALAGFASARMPLELARARLELASAVAADRPEVAIAEARAALAAFEELKAVRHADAATALLRSLGVRPSTKRQTDGAVLTRREAEVLELMCHGLSNPEIAERLYISRKTVEHHVGNVLAKLGLRTRAEAVAFATRRSAGTFPEPGGD